MRVKEENEEAGFKLNIKKTKIMASSPITSREIEGGKMEAVTDFTFLGSKITADSDCSHEIKRHLFTRRKAMTNLDSVLKSRDITLQTKVHPEAAPRACALRTSVTLRANREPLCECSRAEEGAVLHQPTSRAPESLLFYYNRGKH